MAKPKRRTPTATLKKQQNTQTKTVGQKRQLAPSSYARFLPKKFRGSQPKPTYRKLPPARILFLEATKLMLAQWRSFVGIVTVYGVGLLVLVVGFSIGSDFSQARQALNEVFQGKNGANSLFMQVFFLFSNNSTGTSQTAGLYQSLLLIICSLALIWGLREARQGRSFTTKQSFYSGMTPLIPFVLSIAIISIQLLPLTIGAYLYDLVTANSIVVTSLEKCVAFLIFAALGFWSLRMITHSMFTPYIVTLPRMTPLRALGDAKQIVSSRRLVIWRKVLFLPVALIVLLALAIAPFVLFVPAVAPWIFFALTCGAFAVTHAYFYVLYREMIREP
ncbi:MAG: hypothetical protein QG629_560 [Patescibacteria group bacterium]|nr:hypothetical protein [Candidatus Saccharibacteria bacterium]MDQ5963478.1 hypothetical protein [Patescibacteria group bacterium]